MLSVYSEVRPAWYVRPDDVRQILRGELMCWRRHAILPVHPGVADVKLGRANPASSPFKAIRNVLVKFDLLNVAFLTSKASQVQSQFGC